MLTERYGQDFLFKNFLPCGQWRPFPPAGDRQAWDKLCDSELNRTRKNFLIGQAERILTESWPNLPASLFLDAYRTGNRSRFQAPYFLRRQRLGVLALAECMEHRDRFTDAVADALWSICEESTWCVPAHTDALPSPDSRPVDLFACETAMAVAEATYLLRAELDSVSPAIAKRIDHEIVRQIVEPVSRRDDFFWLSGDNNWTPWCCSNALGAAMYVLDDRRALVPFTRKLMAAIDRFIDNYGPDGGCEEGPVYWGVAAGAMLIFLELLHSRSGGKIDIYDQPKIAAMGRYIADFHVDGPWFASFADAGPRHGVKRAVVYQYGRRTGCEELIELALLGMRRWKPDGPVDPPLAQASCGGDIMYMLRELFWIPADAAPRGLARPMSRWYGDIETMIVRQSSISGQGLVLSAKAGHNNVSHNHNDIGQFIIYMDGQPVIIDTGVEEYVRSTFGPNRYDFWYTRSSGHNVPLVGGVEQQAGREFTASDVKFADSADTCRLSMQLAGAYPKNAHLCSLRRELALDRRAGAVTMRDEYKFGDQSPRSIDIPLLTPMSAEIKSAGMAVIKLDGRSVLVQFDPGVLDLQIQAVELQDKVMQKSWGPSLNKLIFSTHPPQAEGSYEIAFQAER